MSDSVGKKSIEQPSTRSILRLPEEILIQIFSSVTLYDLYHSVALVCKTFLRLSRDPSVRRSICLTNQGLTGTSEAEKFVAESHHITSLYIRKRDDANTLLTAALQNCRNINLIEIKFCRPLNESTLTLLSRSNVALKLVHFSLEGTNLVTQESVGDAWHHFFSSASNLLHLNLFGCWFLDGSHLLKIGQCCKRLQYLNLEEVTHLCTTSLASLIIERKETLKYLYLDGEYVTDEFFQHLGKLTRLEHLGIAFADSISSHGMEAIANLPKLTSLKLQRAKELPPFDFISTFSSSKLASLTSLNLSECCLLDDNCLAAISSTCSLLKELVLNWCWELTDKGMEEVLLYCSRLQILSLVGVVRITENILDDIGAALPELKLLDLEQCPNIDDDNLKQVVRNGRPNIEVVNYWGEHFIKSETDYFNSKPHEKDDDGDGSSSGINFKAANEVYNVGHEQIF